MEAKNEVPSSCPIDTLNIVRTLSPLSSHQRSKSYDSAFPASAAFLCFLPVLIVEGATTAQGCKVDRFHVTGTHYLNHNHGTIIRADQTYLAHLPR